MLASRDAATEVGWRLKPAGSSGQPRVRHTERSSLLQKPAQMQLARSAHRVTVLRVEVPCQACGWSLQTVRNWKYLQCASAVLAVCQSSSSFGWPLHENAATHKTHKTAMADKTRRSGVCTTGQKIKNRHRLVTQGPPLRS